MSNVSCFNSAKDRKEMGGDPSLPYGFKKALLEIFPEALEYRSNLDTLMDEFLDADTSGYLDSDDNEHLRIHIVNIWDTVSYIISNARLTNCRQKMRIDFQSSISQHTSFQEPSFIFSVGGDENYSASITIMAKTIFHESEIVDDDTRMYGNINNHKITGATLCGDLIKNNQISPIIINEVLKNFLICAELAQCGCRYNLVETDEFKKHILHYVDDGVNGSLVEYVLDINAEVYDLTFTTTE